MTKMEEKKLSFANDKTEQTNVKVSVIIPVYNTELYLAECLDSIINQSLREIEIICVNDGSTDNSEKILRKYANQDSRISIYAQENLGASAARNKGVKHASGEYLYFMDSDDILEKDALKILSETARENNLQVLYFDGTSFSENNECREAAERFYNYYTRKMEYPIRTTGIQMMLDMIKNDEYRVSCPLQIVKREYFQQNELWFIEGIIYEDNYYTFCCMVNAEKAGYVHIAPYLRRVRKNSVMTKKTSFVNSYSYYINYKKMVEFLQTKHFTDEQSAVIYDLVFRYFRNARDIYEKIEQTEKEKVNGLSEQEKLFYRSYIIEYVNIKEKLSGKCELFQEQKEIISSRLKNIKQENDELKIRLKENYEEKIEIKEKLQSVYNEKSEINKKYNAIVEEKNTLNERVNSVVKEKTELERENNIKDIKIEKMEKEIEILNKNPFIRLKKLLGRIKRKLKRIFRN